MDQENQQNEPKPDPVALNLDEERKKFEAIIQRQNKVTREYNRGKFLSA
ncbi:MAG: hypothetical protein P8J84_09830 [Paracoccaceae bacterium]|jgi:hypothetical protein|nr:hypothetical protein [Paracoccaceae bacterium]